MSTHPSRPARPRWPATIAVLGCGLIGGSIALASRRGRTPAKVLGVDRPRVLHDALALGVIDEGVSLAAFLRGLETRPPDVVVLALPVDEIIATLSRLATASRALAARRRPLILDVGSVKAPIVAAATARGCPRFVGGHPMAGLEREGLAHARADLFRAATFALCPGDASKTDLARARRFVRALGARPLMIGASEHDRIVALTSHLPHLVAWALMDAARDLAARSRTSPPWALAGGSWRDATRVAAADPRAWAPILRHNREAVLESLELVLAALTRVHAGLTADEPVLDDRAFGFDGAALARLARAQRRPTRA